MTYPDGEFPQDMWDSVASQFGPQPGLDPYIVQEQARLQEDMQRDELSGQGAFASHTSSASPAVGRQSRPADAGRVDDRQRERENLLDDQQVAANRLWYGLTRSQRDALLTLSLDGGHALHDLLDDLWREYDDEVG